MILFLLLSMAFAKVEMAITVDDLPNHGKLPQGVTRLDVAEKMLKVFKKHKVPEVYGFINAEKVSSEPETRKVLEAWVNAGYPLGNHTWSHMNFAKNTAEDFEREVLQNEPLLKEISIAYDWKVFRYPYLIEGDTLEKRNEVRRFLTENQYKIAQTTFDFDDWAWNSGYARCKDKNDRKQLKWMRKKYFQWVKWEFVRTQRITDGLFERPIKHILLLHIGAFTTDYLDELLTFYKKQGVKFISLSEAMQDPVYSHDPKQVGTHGIDFPYQVLNERGLKADQFDPRPPLKFPAKELETICE